MNGTVIVGASQAGVQIAATLRELGDDQPITLVGEETQLPYQRPPLSKSAMLEGFDPATLELRSADWYSSRNINLVMGEHVVDVQRDEGGGRLVTASGTELRFDRLALATGAEPRRLTLPGADLAGVHYLRDLRDSGAIGRELAAAQSVIVIGGGFIGLEVAAGARARGLDVTIIEVAPRLVGRVVAEETSAFYLDAHTRRGINVLLGATLDVIVERDGRAGGVRLADGRMINADVILVGVGVLPRTSLAEQLGLHVDGGIVVDSYARTSDGHTVAAGDCTVMPTPYLRGSLPNVRLESVHNAIEQAKIAAATLLGRDEKYVGVPWFWSDQGDLKLQIAGLSTGYDHVVVRGTPLTESFTVLYYRDGLLIAADSVNAPLDHLAVKNTLKADKTIDPDRAADTTVPLKQSARDVAQPAGVS
ncbi:NAD(P)/FAD-dependent oxidoreductase [Pseudolysinimonas sp.]